MSRAEGAESAKPSIRPSAETKSLGFEDSAQPTDWRWCSLWRRRSRDPDTGNILSDWPIDPPRNWLQIVNQPQNEPELAAFRRAVQRNSPFGSPNWTSRAAARLSLQRTLHPLGRPKKTTTS